MSYIETERIADCLERLSAIQKVYGSNHVYSGDWMLAHSIFNHECGPNIKSEEISGIQPLL